MITLLCRRVDDDGDDQKDYQDDDEETALPFPDALGAGDGRLDVRVRVSDVVCGRFHLAKHRESKRVHTYVQRKERSAKLMTCYDSACLTSLLPSQANTTICD